MSPLYETFDRSQTPLHGAHVANRQPLAAFQCTEAANGNLRPCQRHLLAEEPLLIQINDRPLVSLMRTPGHEIDLAVGFLISQGLITTRNEIGAISFCTESHENVIRVIPTPGSALSSTSSQYRHLYSSCSTCGEQVIEELTRTKPPFNHDPGRLTLEGIRMLGETMRQQQILFERSGAAHAAALAVRPLTSEAIQSAIVREDVGRHNALDKVIGAAALQGIELTRTVIFLSGRLSFEMVAKAAQAGIADVVGASGPTALAVSLARRLGMFLAGFARGTALTIYSGTEALQETSRPNNLELEPG